MSGYQGCRAIVTGCASGIGAAVAAGLLARGADVIGLDIHPPAEPDPIDGRSGDVRPIDVRPIDFRQTDLRDARAIDAAMADLDGVDQLFNCAGVTGAAGAPNVLRVNLLGLRHLTELAITRMRRGGSIASVASVGGWAYERDFEFISAFLADISFDTLDAWCTANADRLTPSAYPFSKAGVIVYTIQRAIALAEQGIRINTISPGLVDTPMLNRPAVAAPEFVSSFPLPAGAMSTAEEQAEVLMFLNEPAATAINGVNLWTDGGLMAGVMSGAIASPF